MTDTNVIAPFRIAIRSEGKFVHAYYASMETMEGAMLLGTMRRSTLQNTPGLFEKWRDLLQDAIRQASMHALGTEPVAFVMQPAPENEKSGNA